MYAAKGITKTPLNSFPAARNVMMAKALSPRNTLPGKPWSNFISCEVMSKKEMQGGSRVMGLHGSSFIVLSKCSILSRFLTNLPVHTYM